MRPRRVTDDEILEVARETILELGPSVSTTVIAERLGVSQATLFKRFGSKDALVLAALLPRPEALPLVRLEQGPDDGPLLPQLRSVLLEVGAFFNELAPCLVALRSSGSFPPHFPGGVHSPPIVARIHISRWLERGVETGELRPDVDTEHLAVALFGVVQARVMREHLIGDATLTGTPEDYLDAAVDYVFQGVTA